MPNYTSDLRFVNLSPTPNVVGPIDNNSAVLEAASFHLARIVESRAEFAESRRLTPGRGCPAGRERGVRASRPQKPCVDIVPPIGGLAAAILSESGFTGLWDFQDSTNSSLGGKRFIRIRLYAKIANRANRPARKAALARGAPPS